MGDVERGETIKKRRVQHGFHGVRAFEKATGVPRATITRAEEGRASESTYLRLENWLDRFDQQVGESELPATPATEPGATETVEFTVEGDFGVRVTVKGPITDHDILRSDVTEIIRTIREGNGAG